MTTARTCLVCKKPVGTRIDNPYFPFCSSRCRAVDLGKWLGEEYRVPDRHVEEQEDEGPLPTEGEKGPDA
jgi:endogenous inhibitor of DNA gyrase (YacG/DUF329 family)